MTTIPHETGIADVVDRARHGDEDAWNDLVGRYASLVNSVTRRYRLSTADAADVSQNVWLLLLRHLSDLREPRSLPGWILTTTARECLRLRSVNQRTMTFDPQQAWALEQYGPALWRSVGQQEAPNEELLREESRRSVRQGLAELEPSQSELLLLLFADPPISYRQVSLRLGIPIGSIGPTRARLLRKLERSGAVRRLIGVVERHPDSTPTAA